jgi:hypothetical protein
VTEDEFLRELAVAITRQEDITNAAARDVLYELALRIYALLLRDLPATRFERYLRWPELRRQIMVWLMEANDLLRESLFSRLIATETLILPPIQRYYRLLDGALQPRPVTEVLDATRVVGSSVAQLFTPRPPRGLTPFALQLLQLLERSVIGTFFNDPTTAEVAQKVVGTRTSAGRDFPVVTKGTVANAWAERYRSISAAALWATVTPAQTRAAQVLAAAANQPILPGATPPAAVRQWRWNAVLDPRTCPVCRPLHRTLAPTPQAFPGGPPPLHPACRCIVLPEFV